MTHSPSSSTKRLLAFSLALLCGAASHAQTPQEADYQTKTADLEKLRATIQSLGVDLATERGQQDEVTSALRTTEQEIGALQRDIKQLDGRLQAQSNRLAVLRCDREKQETDLSAERQVLAGQLRAAYAMGRQDYLKMLLNQQNPAAVGRSLVYYEYFNRDRVQRIDHLGERVRQLDALAQDIAQQAQVLAQLRSAQLEKQRALEENRKERSEVLAKLTAEIAGKDEQLARFREDEQQLEQLLSRLQEALATLPTGPGTDVSFASLKGKLAWPAKGRLVAKYGSARLAGALTWRGVLIEAPEGAEVHAVSQGRVVFANWLRGFGLLVIIDHGDGYMSLYGHNQSLDKKAGDWVEAGEVIAAVGESGGSENPGLYFEIRYQGEPSNPVLWCRSDK